MDIIYVSDVKDLHGLHEALFANLIGYAHVTDGHGDELIEVYHDDAYSIYQPFVSY